MLIVYIGIYIETTILKLIINHSLIDDDLILKMTT